ncbi:type II toxin-antitoxin system PemK/MazF family toxin [Caulobacter sp. LjRoot300]|uniref:type II toxin-antitoxin system PemK/MazF family toxin n=1 Tax=Caulobacter sp. LjRoot300 TaxID=3342321 RepID=UPI003F5086E6
MVKRRPVIVISPKILARPGLCTVVSLSTTAPTPPQSYNCQIDIRPELPDWMRSDGVWVKGDMISSVAFHRLDFIRLGKAADGRRQYYYSRINREDISRVRACVLHGIGLAHLTKHL